jgi:hypothetical protein
MSLQDLAFAGGTLRKSPVFAITAALTIALGVGASTAIWFAHRLRWRYRAQVLASGA